MILCDRRGIIEELKKSTLVTLFYATCMIAKMATSAKKFRAIDDELDGGGGGGAEQCERLFIFGAIEMHWLCVGW